MYPDFYPTTALSRWTVDPHPRPRKKPALNLASVTPTQAPSPPIAPNRPSMTSLPPHSELPSNGANHDTINAPKTEEDRALLKKLAEIQLLPDLFALLQRVETGEIKGQDFDNHAGPIRLKLNNIRMYLQEVEGICETVEERGKKIEMLKDCNDRRASFLSDFNKRVVKDLSQM
ncbi:hypothetical protein JCM33374_g6514 [Metschnikowia sp. JCM 33374]|nr:hypothetical protein JCM33374_g6514 [Metschnikowia sp. JCM 33374]